MKTLAGFVASILGGKRGHPRLRKLHPRTRMSRREKLWLFVFVVSAGICSQPNWAYAQDDRAGLPDSPSHVSRSSSHDNDSRSEREVSWHSLPKDFLQDQK